MYDKFTKQDNSVVYIVSFGALEICHMSVLFAYIQICIHLDKIYITQNFVKKPISFIIRSYSRYLNVNISKLQACRTIGAFCRAN